MNTLIVSETEVSMSTNQIGTFLDEMQDVINAAADVNIKKNGKKAKVTFAFVTFETSTIDSFLCRLADNGLAFSEQRHTIEELREAFFRANEFGIWQMPSLLYQAYGVLSLEEFRSKRGLLDLSLHKRIYGGTLAQLNIDPSLSSIQILQQIYSALNQELPLSYTGRPVSVGDVIQLRGEYYYVDPSAFVWIAVM